MREGKFFIYGLLFVGIGFSYCRSNSSSEANSLKKHDRVDSAQMAAKARKQQQLESLSEKIGEKFQISDFIDTSGRPVKLDFTKSDFTIIDFWINECPPCNAEMSQFKNLIQNKDLKISIISISVSNYGAWKQLFIDKNKRYSFLLDSISNWHHVALKSNDDPALKNPISTDRYNQISTDLHVAFFPSYFVLDKSGTILARPESAVDYIVKTLKL